MFNSYSTDYANEVHQLTVSVSKHYWVTKDGIVKYQQKPIEVKLDKVRESSKTHLVLYVLRDHFSGLFYARVEASSSLMAPIDFLKSAWKKKPNFVFSGLPAYVAITDTVEAAFPGTRQAVADLGVGLPKVTSGFHGGIREIRTIEERLNRAHDQSVESAKNYCLKIGRDSERERCMGSHQTKAEVWAANLRGEQQGE